MKRSSGILLHPTSLPGPYGIGDLGGEAKDFVDWLADAGQSLWQVLPLGPTGYGDSPYAAFSSHAGNPLLIALESLVGIGLLGRAELEDGGPVASQENRVDYGRVIPWKSGLLVRAAERFIDGDGTGTGELRTAYRRFVADEASWLDDYCLFMDIKEHFDALAQEEGISGAMWSNYWPKDLALRDREALAAWSDRPDHRRSMEVRKAIQFFFFSQWTELKAYANGKGISIIGDIPIFVAADSVDVWASPSLFLLDDRARPRYVAGVPPDYFSRTGQLWGNPLYDWAAMEEGGYRWWLDRIDASLSRFDWLRIDHFRGFEAFWAVPFGEATAEHGTWMKGPGRRFFDVLEEHRGTVPILAEDLGFITPEVQALRDTFSFPGMRILQFAFDAKEGNAASAAKNPFLPHNYVRNTVAYTGTHDNDTMAGWLAAADQEELAYVRDYLGCVPGEELAGCVRAVLGSVADFAILPFQDVLGLGAEARMNRPSTVGENWTWRATPEQLQDRRPIARLRRSCELYGRI